MSSPESVASFCVPNSRAITGAIKLLPMKRTQRSAQDSYPPRGEGTNLMKHPPKHPTITLRIMIMGYPSARFHSTSCAKADIKMAPNVALATPMRSAKRPTVMRPMADEKFMTATGATESWDETFGTLSSVKVVIN